MRYRKDKEIVQKLHKIFYKEVKDGVIIREKSKGDIYKESRCYKDKIKFDTSYAFFNEL